MSNINLDEAIRLIEESPLNIFSDENLQEYILEYPEVGRQVFASMSDEKVYSMCKMVGASVYSLLITAGRVDVMAIDKDLFLDICAVAMRATAGLLTMEEIR